MRKSNFDGNNFQFFEDILRKKKKPRRRRAVPFRKRGNRIYKKWFIPKNLFYPCPRRTKKRL